MCAILAPKAMDYISLDNIKFFVYCKPKIPNLNNNEHKSSNLCIIYTSSLFIG